MKATITIFLSILASNVFALSVKDVMYINGLENSHYAYWDQWEEDKYMRKPGKNWILLYNDSTIRVDEKSMSGLILNNFESFYHDEEIGNVSSLRRESPEYAERFTNADAKLKKLRDDCISNGVHRMVEGNDIWYGEMNHRYIKDKDCFEFTLPYAFIPVRSRKRHPAFGWANSYTAPVFSQNLISKFNKEETRILPRHYELLPVNKIDVPIANKQVAIEIDEQRGLKKRYPYELFYQMHLVDCKPEYDETGHASKQTLPYLEVTDIILVHMPTQQVVWTAMTGDHSAEMTF